MSDNGAGKLIGKLKNAQERNRLERLVSVFRHEDGEDVRPIIIVDPNDPERLRMIPAIGAGGGAIPGTRGDLAADVDEWEGGRVAERGLPAARPREQPPKVRLS